MNSCAYSRLKLVSNFSIFMHYLPRLVIYSFHLVRNQIYKFWFCLVWINMLQYNEINFSFVTIPCNFCDEHNKNTNLRRIGITTSNEIWTSNWKRRFMQLKERWQLPKRQQSSWKHNPMQYHLQKFTCIPILQHLFKPSIQLIKRKQNMNFSSKYPKIGMLLDPEPSITVFHEQSVRTVFAL